MIKRKLLISLIILVILLIIGIGYIGAKQLTNRDDGRKTISELMEENPIGKVGKSERDSDKVNVIVGKEEADISNWKTYKNEELGITFKYPREYCVVGFFTREEVRKIGHYDLGSSSPKYYLEIQEPQFTRCIEPYQLGYLPILNIQVSVDSSVFLTNQSTSDVKIFKLPLIAIDGIPASRFISGEGTPNGGVPFYKIRFKKDNFNFSLFTDVNCTAKDGSCKPPRDENFIKEIDKIVTTIQFTR